MALNQVGLERLNDKTTKVIGTNKNVIINGAAMVNQRGNKTGATTGGFAADRFECVMNETGTLTISQAADAPSGFTYSHKLIQTTAQGSLAANDLTAWRYNVEGFDVQRFKKGTSDAQEFTVSFHVKSIDQSSYPVTYILELRDPINTRSCCKSYTVTQSDTWEYKTLTFPADTTGTWTANNSKSLEMNWFCAAGSNYTGGTLSTSWATTVTANRAAGLTANLSANTSNRFAITGVQLEVGSVATDFEHRSYGKELELCQRYYYLHAAGTGMGGNSGETTISENATMYQSQNMFCSIKFPTQMRAKPTLEIVTGSNYYISFSDGSSRGNFTGSNTSLNSATSTNIAAINNSDTGSSTSGHTAIWRTSNAAARVAFTAEL